MARRRNSRRFTRGKREYVWTAALVDETVSTGVGGGAVIVAGVDWFASGSARRQATLLRIRGWLAAKAVTADTTIGASNHWTGYIAKFVSDESAVNPGLVGAYTDENILWTGGGVVMTYQDNTNGVGWAIDLDLEIDVKAKRRISNDDGISLVYTIDSISGSKDVRTYGVLRGLVALG